ncbi:MAG: hypothetical protein EXR47_04080 [Dehalococcoidia bacterium]|nr:hypothetical protein [Dehalococcoidia bacterium]
MQSPTGDLVLLFTVLLLGLIHGVDWDHIAAISDITGTVAGRRRGFSLATAYVLGHAFVVTGLGMLAILAGLALPGWVDAAMERIVGATLIFLAAWIIYSLFKKDDQFQLRSRWMLMFDGFRAISAWVSGRIKGDQKPFAVRASSAYGVRTAWGIGMLHGIGAETATQAVLFLAVAGAGGKALGVAMLAAFVVGLIIANSAITAASLAGFRVARRGTPLRVAAGLIAAFSIAVGLLFLLGQGGGLLGIIGWEPALGGQQSHFIPRATFSQGWPIFSARLGQG